MRKRQYVVVAQTPTQSPRSLCPSWWHRHSFRPRFFPICILAINTPSFSHHPKGGPRTLNIFEYRCHSENLGDSRGYPSYIDNLKVPCFYTSFLNVTRSLKNHHDYQKFTALGGGHHIPAIGILDLSLKALLSVRGCLWDGLQKRMPLVFVVRNHVKPHGWYGDNPYSYSEGD